MIIDCHTHGMHAGNLEAIANAGGPWAKENVEARIAYNRNSPIFSNAALRVEQLDKCGYDYQVVTIVWRQDSNLNPASQNIRLAYARAMNDNMARLQDDGKGRLLCIGNVPIEDYENGGRQETERAIRQLGLKGLSLCTNVRGRPIDLPEFEPFWAHVEEMGLPLLLHPGNPASPVGRQYETRFDLAHNIGWPFETMLALFGLVFSGVMERHPKLKIISHHCGGGLPFIFGRTLETYEGKIEDKIGRPLSKPIEDYFKLFYYDTAIGGSAAAIKCTHEVFGPDRMLFATDAPYGPGSGEHRLMTYPKVVRSCGFSAEDNSKIFDLNPKRVFGIK